MYPTDIITSEVKFLPPSMREGDQLVSVSFLKGDGIGIYNVEGTVSANGAPIEYVDMGSYGGALKPTPEGPVELKINAAGGDEATFVLEPVPPIELLTVNGETNLPIIDVGEDMTVEFTNPPGSENTRIRVSLLTKVMGVTALNHFADFEAGTEATRTVKIPKESLANPEISGQMNVGNFDKGDNYIIIERERKLNKEDYPEGSDPGALEASEISVRSYSSMPVIVKGKQEDGILTVLKIRGKSEDKKLGYSFYKPNAQTGIPFSEASKFGLVSFTLRADTYKQETETSTSSWTVGNTRYTQTTITTTTYEFPQLPESHWDYAMDKIYTDLVSFFQTEYGIEFVDVETVTSAPLYATTFPASESISKSVVKKTYKDTQRITPKSMSEIFGSASSNITSDNPRINLMKEAGDVDGMLSIDVNLRVGVNSANNIVLVPNISISASGRDETNGDKEGKYFDGQVSMSTGQPFNEEAVKADPDELVRVISHPQLFEAIKLGINNMRAKEVELGYDKIWNIGEE